eukprot:608743-Prymnesium_polylepis.1
MGRERGLHGFQLFQEHKLRAPYGESHGKCPPQLLPPGYVEDAVADEHVSISALTSVGCRSSHHARSHRPHRASINNTLY